ncbi:MAG TPA: dipeptidase [Phycisphaerae bacterium]|nr:dipeptidase [Phycisphaerae bacterium]
MRAGKLWLVLAVLCLTTVSCSHDATGVQSRVDRTSVLPAAGNRKHEPVELTDEARRIHRAGLLIDGHNDLAEKIRDRADSSFDKLDISRPQKDLHTDIPRLRRGGVGAQFWVAWVPPEKMRTGGAARYALEQIDLIYRMVQRYAEHFEMAYSADDVVRIHRAGKIAALIAVEGGHAIEGSLGVLRMFHALGARYMTLTHSETHDWADSATDEPRHGGLSPFGETVIQEMNRLGMLVDISHVSAEAMRDVLRVSRAPVIASHSSAYAVAPHPRNVPDDVLHLVAANGGVVMVNFFSGFVDPEGARVTQRVFQMHRELREKHPDDADFQKAWQQWRRANPIPAGSVHTLVDHIDHIARVAGIDHVGLGSDYDGISKTPVQLEDVSCYPYITQELLSRGYSREDIHKIMGGNLLRALRRAEDVARNWKDER